MLREDLFSFGDQFRALVIRRTRLRESLPWIMRCIPTKEGSST